MWQLIYTSAPSGLTPGRSGFCTVARHYEIPKRLVTSLERISPCDPPPPADAPIYTHRIIILANETYSIITRYCDAGLDYTSRRNALAHHLIFPVRDTKDLPPPAEIARRWPAWASTWQEAPRWLDDTDSHALPENTETTLPAKTWQTLTGDAGNAALLCPDATAVEAVLDISRLPAPPDADTLLRLFAEASLLLRGGPWAAGFTTQTRPADVPAQTPWRTDTVADATAHARQLIVNLAHPAAVASTNPIVKHARTGVSPEKQPHAADVPQLRKTRTNTAATSEADGTDAPARRHSPARVLAFIGGALCAIAAVVGTWFYLTHTDSSGTTAPIANAQPPAPPPDPEKIKRIAVAEKLRADIARAIATKDWPTAATLWITFATTEPDLAIPRRKEFYLPIQQNLAAAHVARLEAQFNKLAPAFDPKELAACRMNFAAAKAQISRLEAVQSKDVLARFERFAAHVALLDSLPVAPPPVAFLVWENPEKGLRAPVGERHLRFTAPALNEFLRQPHGSITLTLTPIEAWLAPASAQAATLTIPSANYQAGKVLFIRTVTQGAPRLRLNVEPRDTLKLEQNTATTAPTPIEALLATAKSFQLTLDDTADDKPPVSLLFLSPQTPPTPVRAPRSLLAEEIRNGTDPVVSIPLWLCDALGRFQISGASLILYPRADADVANYFTTSTVSNADVENALRRGYNLYHERVQKLTQRIATLEKRLSLQTLEESTDTTTELTQLRRYQAESARQREAINIRATKYFAARKAATPDAPFELLQRSPWVAALVDQKTGRILPLVIFE